MGPVTLRLTKSWPVPGQAARLDESRAGPGRTRMPHGRWVRLAAAGLGRSFAGPILPSTAKFTSQLPWLSLAVAVMLRKHKSGDAAVPPSTREVRMKFPSCSLISSSRWQPACFSSSCTTTRVLHRPRSAFHKRADPTSVLFTLASLAVRGSSGVSMSSQPAKIISLDAFARRQWKVRRFRKRASFYSPG